MTPRRAAVLAMQLPAGAQTWVACGHDNAWTQAEHLAALQFDAIQIANWQRGGGTSSDMPEPLSRPSDAKEKASKRDRLAVRAQAAYDRQQAAQADHTTEAP